MDTVRGRSGVAANEGRVPGTRGPAKKKAHCVLGYLLGEVVNYAI